METYNVIFFKHTACTLHDLKVPSVPSYKSYEIVWVGILQKYVNSRKITGNIKLRKSVKSITYGQSTMSSFYILYYSPLERV